MKLTLQKHKLISDILKILGGNVVAQGLVFFSVAIIANAVGPERYGVYTTAVSFFTILLQLSDLGISTSYIRYFKSREIREDGALGTALLSKIGIALITSFLILLFSNGIANQLNLFGEDSNVIKWIAVFLPFHVIYTTFIAHFQAREQFGIYSIVNLVHGLAKLGIAVALAMILEVTQPLYYFLATYFLAILFLAPMVRLSQPKLVYNKGFSKNIFRLGFWIFLSTAAAAVIMQIDVFLLQRLHSAKEAGIFSAAMSMAMAIPLITTSISTAVLPKVDDFLQSGNSSQYMKSVLRYWPFVIVATFVLHSISPILIKLVFNQSYSGALPAFRVLVVAFMIGLLVNPISLIYYYINKAKILSIMNWAQLILSLILGIWMIPSFGALGASWSVLAVRLLGAFVVLSYLWYYQENGNS